jgi:hypothetical protein
MGSFILGVVVGILFMYLTENVKRMPRGGHEDDDEYDPK